MEPEQDRFRVSGFEFCPVKEPEQDHFRVSGIVEFSPVMLEPE